MEKLCSRVTPHPWRYTSHGLHLHGLLSFFHQFRGMSDDVVNMGDDRLDAVACPAAPGPSLASHRQTPLLYKHSGAV